MDQSHAIKLANRAWEAAILAFHTTGGLSNGPTEAVNLLIKKVKRLGQGFRNFGTTGRGCCCTAVSPGELTEPARLRGTLSAWWRRAV